MSDQQLEQNNEARSRAVGSNAGLGGIFNGEQNERYRHN